MEENDIQLGDSFVQCPHCGSVVCYSQKAGELETLICMSCGFTTTNQMQDGSEAERAVFEKNPSLYKDIRFIDKFGYVWYPAVIAVPDAGMVYVDGTSAKDWQWVSVPNRKLTRHERRSGRYPKDQEYIAITDHLKKFGQDGFVEAMSSIGLFGRASEGESSES